MKPRTILASLAVLVVAVALGAAENPNMGTWKLNEAKSTFSPGAPKNTKVVYAAMGDSVKITVDGVDGSGKPAHNEWTGKFDGKDYPVTGDPNTDARSYTKADDHTLAVVNKKGGKTVSTGKIVVAADGKTRTLTASGIGPDGKEIKVTAVYDKQ